jgi:hypothetical protein
MHWRASAWKAPGWPTSCSAGKRPASFQRCLDAALGAFQIALFQVFGGRQEIRLNEAVYLLQGTGLSIGAKGQAYSTE